jgi:spore coat polysaccharide biosynthesis predicted glycosyltransferase SpsG
MKKIVIRTHGGSKIGLGHVMRCLSIAQGLKQDIQDDSFEIEWITNNEAVPFIEKKGFRATISESFNTTEKELYQSIKPDCILIDTYVAGNAYLAFLKSVSKMVVLIDDNNDRYVSEAVDLVINGNIHADTLSYRATLPNAKTLLGPAYLAMKEEYWDPQTTEPPEPDSLLVTVGGADPFNVMELYAEALKDYPVSEKMLIIGPSFESLKINQIKNSFGNDFHLIFSPDTLKPYIQRAGIVITAAGSTVYEVLRLCRIPIIFEIADNQKRIATALQSERIMNLGRYQELSSGKILDTVRLAFGSKHLLDREYRELFSLFDGQGVHRIVRSLDAIIGGKDE